MDQENDYFKGRGAQLNPNNKFAFQRYVNEHVEGLDEPFLENSVTQFYEETPKQIISSSNSPDLPFMHSINPYQGCEHGCIYCYARNSHEYWGYSPGLDFERKIIIKPNAAALLEQAFNKKNYKPATIMLSGNTDCYQPIERKLGITRALLKVFLKYRHPVSLITKNNLILRDIDILKELAKYNLVRVAISLNSLDEKIRHKMEPRTVTAKGRLKVMQKLSEANIPVMLMCAPIVPGLNSDEMPEVIKSAAQHGTQSAGFTIVRLNGAIGPIFEDWILKAFPDRAEKVLNMIKDCHDGNLNDSRWKKRMSGTGQLAESIHTLFRISVKRYMGNHAISPLRTDLFVSKYGQQLNLF